MTADDKELTVALWQGRTVAGDLARALAEVRRGAGAAAAAGAAVIVFPELFLSGYEREDLAALALAKDECAARLGEIAREAGVAICAGYPERLRDTDRAGGRLANAALCVSVAGEALANHRKIQLYGQVEPTRFLPGECYSLCEIAGRKMAVLICYDVEFAPHVAALASEGVEVILAPTAAMHPFTQVGEHVVPAMAMNHGVAIVYANLCGREGSLDFFGRSTIVTAGGQVIARAGEEPCILIATLPSVPGPLSTQLADYRRVGG